MLLYFSFEMILKIEPPFDYINLTKILKKLLSNNKIKSKNDTNVLEFSFENGISLEKEAFLKLINCKRLNRLSFKKENSQITCLRSQCFDGLWNLNDLYLNDCKIQKIEFNSFSHQLSNLIELDLSENYLEEIEDNIFISLKYLEYLYLSDCNIRKINKNAFSGLISLKTLDLSNNKLSKELDENTFRDLKILQEINMVNLSENNSLQSIISKKDLFNKLVKLKSIGFSSRDFDLYISILKSISITLNTNDSSKVNLINRIKMILINEKENENFLKSIQLGLYFDQIETLDLGYSEIFGINNQLLKNLTKLKKLKLNDCLLTTIETNSFDDLINLETLDLSYNVLDGTNFEQLFSNLTNLKYLNLANNQLQIVKNQYFIGISKLECLILQNCQINTIEPGAFNNLIGLTTLDLSKNINLNPRINEENFKEFGNLKKLFL